MAELTSRACAAVNAGAKSAAGSTVRLEGPAAPLEQPLPATPRAMTAKPQTIRRMSRLSSNACTRMDSTYRMQRRRSTSLPALQSGGGCRDCPTPQSMPHKDSSLASNFPPCGFVTSNHPDVIFTSGDDRKVGRWLVSSATRCADAGNGGRHPRAWSDAGAASLVGESLYGRWIRLRKPGPLGN